MSIPIAHPRHRRDGSAKARNAAFTRADLLLNSSGIPYNFNPLVTSFLHPRKNGTLNPILHFGIAHLMAAILEIDIFAEGDASKFISNQ